MSIPITRSNLRLVIWVPEGEDMAALPQGTRRLTDAEFDTIVRAEGYVKIVGVDVEELRRVMTDPERLVKEPSLTDWCVLVDTAQIVLVATAEQYQNGAALAEGGITDD